MPNAERIAELQRVAYGAGSRDVERRAALDELGAHPIDRGVETTPDVLDPPGPDGRRPAATDGEAPFEPGAADAGTTPPSAVRLAGRPVRLLVAVGAVALVAGIGIGWGLGAVPAAGIATGADEPPSRTSADDDVAPPAATGTATGTGTEAAEPVPAAEAPAMAVFDREQTESDRTPMAGGDDPMFDPLTQRRLITFADGAIFSAALDDAGGICLAFDRPDGGGASVCTGETSFPPEGLHFDSTFEGRIDYDLQWFASGEIRVLRTPAG